MFMCRCMQLCILVTSVEVYVFVCMRMRLDSCPSACIRQHLVFPNPKPNTVQGFGFHGCASTGYELAQSCINLETHGGN